MTVEGVRVGVDVGGTFTDLVAWDAAGADMRSCKVPTTPADARRGRAQRARRARPRGRRR